MNGAVAIAPIEMNVSVWSRDRLCKGRGERKQEIRRSLSESSLEQRVRPGVVELVGNDQIDASLLQYCSRAADGIGGSLLRPHAVHDRAHTHIGELQVIAHLSVEHDNPAVPVRYPQEAWVSLGIYRLQSVLVALRHQAVGSPGAIPCRIGPTFACGRALRARYVPTVSDNLHAEP